MKKLSNICTTCGSGAGCVRGSELCFNCYVAAKDAAKGEKPKRIINHDEDDIQKAFFRAARIAFPKVGKLLFAVPNGGKRDKKEASRLKSQGVVAGISDIVCLIPNNKYFYLCLETKTEKGSQSDEQKEFQHQIEAAGGLYVVFRSAGEGINILKEYLKTSSWLR